MVVCNRYHDGACGVGLVHGFSLRRGAIASSISHDAHNIIAVGTSDREILSAIREIIRLKGAMVAVMEESKAILPLECGGLMSTIPYRDVVKQLHDLREATSEMGSINDPFMYLSFLALTVMPALRITTRGLFDGAESCNVPLFEE